MLSIYIELVGGTRNSVKTVNLLMLINKMKHTD